MDHALVAIKRLCRADRVAFTTKAELELERDNLEEEDVVEAILNTDSIQKKIALAKPEYGTSRDIVRHRVHQLGRSMDIHIGENRTRV